MNTKNNFEIKYDEQDMHWQLFNGKEIIKRFINKDQCEGYLDNILMAISDRENNEE
jgi:hypothetical protein